MIPWALPSSVRQLYCSVASKGWQLWGTSAHHIIPWKRQGYLQNVIPEGSKILTETPSPPSAWALGLEFVPTPYFWTNYCPSKRGCTQTNQSYLCRWVQRSAFTQVLGLPGGWVDAWKKQGSLRKEEGAILGKQPTVSTAGGPGYRWNHLDLGNRSLLSKITQLVLDEHSRTNGFDFV